jgi:tocopherol O-methyltransferase
VADHYDDLDRFYREIWGEHLHHGLFSQGHESPEQATRALADLVADLSQIVPGSQVCDVGCGYGATARLLFRERGARVTALSLSQAQLAYARAQTNGAGPTYLLRNWLDNQLPDASFDAVIAIESSEHMEDKVAFFREAHRVLRPGGRMVVCAWLAAEAPHPLFVRHLLQPICSEGRLPSMGSAAEYRAFFAGAGLVLDNEQDLSREVKRTWPICVVRALRGLVREPSYRRWLLSGGSQNRVFALTLLRIWAAYESSAMRYGVFAAHRPL